MLLLLSFFTTNAQIVENFSDGDFTINPVWSGDMTEFTVNGVNQLQLNTTVAGTSYLSTSLLLTSLNDIEWRISVRQNFSPSSTNRGKVYLVSDAENLESTTLNGYYLQLGENNATDVVELFKQQGNTSTSILRGTTNISTAFQIDIKVTRNSTAGWHLFVKSVTDVNFGAEEATNTDNTFNSSSFFGVVCIYTVTNNKRFYFDNISVTSLPDYIPPVITTVTAINNNNIEVVFNEPLAASTASVTGNYFINNNIGNPSSVGLSANKIMLTFTNGFIANQPYILTVNGVSDLAGNSIAANSTAIFSYISTVTSVVTVPAVVLNYKDIVINELMIDPNPPVGLPNVEYMELYNNTNQSLNLHHFVLNDGSVGRTFISPVTLPGNGYLIICNNSTNKAFLESIVSGIQIYTLSGFGLTDNGETETLKDATGKVIDDVNYKNSWYKDAGKANGGYALELINPVTMCSGEKNWIASNNENGGTPGSQNSVYNSNSAAANPVINEIKIVSLSQIKIAFSSSMDSISLKTGVYSVSGGIIIQSILPVPPNYDTVNVLFASPVEVGKLYAISIENVKDCSGNTLVENIVGFSKNRLAAANEVVINEFFPSPYPSVGLPEYEFIELFNTTDQTLDLSGFILKDATVSSNGKLPSGATIPPGGFLILCSTSNVSYFSGYGKTVGVSGFPSLNSTNETLSLLDANSNPIYSISYTDNWYKDKNKKEGGWTLERINPYKECGGVSNWIASVNSSGGTPGIQNSVFNVDADGTFPSVTGVYVINTSTIGVVFSEALDTIGFMNSDFSIDSLTIQSVILSKINVDTIFLKLSRGLVLGKVYTLQIQNLYDCSGNQMVNTTREFGLGRKPRPLEIVINEFFPSPSPSVGLPEYEFIELFNTTNQTLDLSGFVLRDATVSSNGKLPTGTTISPNGFLILCSTSNVSYFSGYGKTVGVSGFPSLNSTNETLSLFDANNTLIHSVNYTDNWYRDKNKKEGGWTLERINPYKTCGKASNWIASVNPLGGTPGTQNSVFNTGKDNSFPMVTGITIINNYTLGVTFSEALDTINLNKNPFSIDHIFIQSARLSLTNADTVFVEFIKINAGLDSGKIYTLQIQDLYDCSGNKMEYTSSKLGLGRKPKPFEIVINEILADETPHVGLPEAEFVELFNTTDLLLDLTGCKLTDGSSVGKFPAGAVIQPNSYLIVCSTSHADDFKPYGDTYGITSFPSLNVTNESLIFSDARGYSISHVKYFDSWYKDASKKEGGWTLERVDPLNPCGTSNNWAASVDARGGTPGRQNSIYAQNPDNTGPKLANAFAISLDTLLVNFDEPIDSISMLNANITLNNNKITSRLVYTDYLKAVVTPPFVEGINYTVFISNLRDCVGNYIGNQNTASFYLAEQGDSSDIILNEVLFNPKPGSSDFVEIYNRSNKYINLKNWQLANVDSKTSAYANFSTITSDNHLIKPKQYRVFSLDKASVENFYQASVDSNFVVMPKLPAYNDDEGSVIIFNNQHQLVDRFDYKEEYHFKLIDNKEGVSLERISFDLPGNTPENWVSAAATTGYATPGYQNSQSHPLDINGEKPVKIDPEVFTPDEDGFRDFTTISFNVSSPGTSGSISIFDATGRMVRKLVRNQLLGSNVFYQWDGLDDSNHKVRTGYYMVYVEIFDLSGNTNAYKQPVVVGAKF